MSRARKEVKQASRPTSLLLLIHIQLFTLIIIIILAQQLSLNIFILLLAHGPLEPRYVKLITPPNLAPEVQNLTTTRTLAASKELLLNDLTGTRHTEFLVGHSLIKTALLSSTELIIEEERDLHDNAAATTLEALLKAYDLDDLGGAWEDGPVYVNVVAAAARTGESADETFSGVAFHTPG